MLHCGSKDTLKANLVLCHLPSYLYSQSTLYLSRCYHSSRMSKFLTLPFAREVPPSLHSTLQLTPSFTKDFESKCFSLDCYFHAPTLPSVPHQSLGVPTSIMWSLPSLPCRASTAQMSSPPKISEHVSTHNLYLPRQGTGQLVIATLRGFHCTLSPTPQLYLSPVRHGNLLKHG